MTSAIGGARCYHGNVKNDVSNDGIVQRFDYVYHRGTMVLHSNMLQVFRDKSKGVKLPIQEEALEVLGNGSAAMIYGMRSSYLK